MRPPWEPPQDTALDLVIDPGRAFGTGAHATTRLCLELLLDLPPPQRCRPLDPQPLRDRPRLRLGRACDRRRQARAGRPVLALDYDQLAVDATLENAAVNGVAAA